MRSLNIAHRGFSGQYTENTMTAFEKAYEEGADGIELDVRLTKDGQVVIFHDTKIDRMTETKGAVNMYTLEELRSRPIITHPLQKSIKQEVVPTLSEYLEWVEDKPLLTNIELKSIKKNYRLELRVAEAIQTYKMEERVFISSFQENSLIRIKILAPSVKTGLLLSKYDESTLVMAKELDLDYLHLRADRLTAENIKTIHELGLQINTWTVNEVEDLKKVNALGLHGIITDYPDRLREIQAHQLNEAE